MKTLLFVSLLFVLQVAFTQNGQSWPKVHPFSHEWHIPNASKPDADTPVVAFIRNGAGQPAYKLECHSGEYSDQSEMNFSGTYQCALFALKNGHNASWDLLADGNHQDSDWDNRGRMIAQQLAGSCSEIPGYGTRRSFALRGMRLELMFKDLNWDPGSGSQSGKRHLKSFTLAAIAQPDLRKLCAGL